MTISAAIVVSALYQANDVQQFEGEQKPAKEWECVIIFDEEFGVRPSLIPASSRATDLCSLGFIYVH